MPTRIHSLALFLSNRGSLYRWQQEGILSREIALYLHHVEHGHFQTILIFSYDQRDIELIHTSSIADPRYGAIIILAPPRWLFRYPFIWSLLGPFIHRKVFASASVLKTNQISGCWSAIFARLMTGTPLLLRLGYLLSRRFHLNGHLVRGLLAQMIEYIGFHIADHVIVSSRDMLNNRQAANQGSKTSLLPTYVDTQTFSAHGNYSFTRPLVTVCRLTPQKNLLNLIAACTSIGMSLTIYGTGPQEEELRNKVRTDNAKVLFKGTATNDELAIRLHDHDLFILPSLHEGLPKALIEAMGSGLICAGSNIPGITDLIDDGVNGYLIDRFEADDIAAALRRIDQARDPQIGRSARKTIEQNFSIERYAAREAAICAGLQ